MDERSHSFVLRIWEEPREQDGAEPIWRGSMEEVLTGTRVYFSTLLDLCDHLGRSTGMPNPRRSLRERLLARSRHWRAGGR
ncbi:MAG TPA: hypothetical protein VGP33_13430 [Chloroflexota bacterium]|nr:hypothetical protein [Chloroflexota bacterium]